MAKVKLLRPLDGREIGETVDYPDADAKRLQDMGVVKIVAEKAETAAPANKAEAKAPANKSMPKKKGNYIDDSRTH